MQRETNYMSFKYAFLRNYLFFVIFVIHGRNVVQNLSNFYFLVFFPVNIYILIKPSKLKLFSDMTGEDDFTVTFDVKTSLIEHIHSRVKRA